MSRNKRWQDALAAPLKGPVSMLDIEMSALDGNTDVEVTTRPGGHICVRIEQDEHEVYLVGAQAVEKLCTYLQLKLKESQDGTT